MRFLIPLALASSWVLTMGAQPSAKVFNLTTIESRCPEYGTLLKLKSLTNGKFDIRYCDLENWVVQVDVASQSVTYQAPDLGTFLTLKIIEKTTIPTNQINQPNPAVHQAAKWVRNLNSAATIRFQSDCYFAGAKGQSIDFDCASDYSKIQGRLVWLDFPGCELVITLKTTGDFKPAHVVFTRFLNSLQLETARAKPTTP